MKQATMIIALLGAIVMAGCGGNGDTVSQSTFNNGSGNQPFKPTTHLSHRSLVTNEFAGQIQVMDATQDRLTTFTFPVGTQPTYMQSSPDGTLTLINNSGSSSISSFNNNLESVKANIILGGFTESFVASVSNKTGFAAVPNFSNATFRTPGAIVPFNPTDGSLNTAIPFPNVRIIAMDPAEKHLLAFTDSDDNAHWVDLNHTDPVTQLPPVTTFALPTGTRLSRPVAAFFTADSSKVFVLSCGVECGGLDSPSVTEIDFDPTTLLANTLPTITAVNQLPVSGARRGLIDLTAQKLYVSGSTTTTLTDSGGNIVQDGFFTVIDLATRTASAPIRIGNGAKRWIRNVKGVFWVASLGCGVQSCITMVNPAAGTATVLPTAKGDATGISFTANRGEVYTIEGGELNIYDQKGNPITSEFATDVRGQASDVLYIN